MLTLARSRRLAAAHLAAQTRCGTSRCRRTSTSNRTPVTRRGATGNLSAPLFSCAASALQLSPIARPDLSAGAALLCGSCAVHQEVADGDRAALGERVLGGALRWNPGPSGRCRRGDHDGLRIEELAHAGGREFAAIAGVLDAAEGQARIAGHLGIEEDGPGLEFGGKEIGRAHV